MIVLAGALSVLAFSGCRKKNDTAMELATKPAHCYNGELDADELAVDYGGSCGTSSSAVSMSSDCGMADNTAKITSDAPATYNHTVTSCTRTSSGGNYVYNIMLNTGRYIYVTTRQTATLNADLDIMSTPMADNECAVTFYMGPYSGSCSGGSGSQVRIKYDGTDYAVNICTASWYAGFNYGSISAYATVN